MKTLKTLLAVSFFIAMFVYVQSEEKKAKEFTQPNLTAKNDSISLKLAQYNSNNSNKLLLIKK
ncbi:MAG: hypothetical protein KA206_07775 [Paludibacter sp.]|nr:hypothetical protein [Paludibacter sp.]